MSFVDETGAFVDVQPDPPPRLSLLRRLIFADIACTLPRDPRIYAASLYLVILILPSQL